MINTEKLRLVKHLIRAYRSHASNTTYLLAAWLAFVPKAQRGLDQCIVIDRSGSLTDFLKQTVVDIEAETFFCDACGDEHNLLETIAEDPDLVMGDETFCYECYENGDVRRCDGCGDYMHCDDSYFATDTENHYCSRCADERLRVCEACHEYVENWEITYDGECVCTECADVAYYRCADCGELCHEDDMIYNEEQDENYCPRCAPSHEADDEVHEYSWKPNPQFKYNGGEEYHNEYFGIELEVSGSQRHAPEFLDFFGPRTSTLYLKSDCSIRDGGFEIVTQPMSYDYIVEDFKPQLDNGLQYLRKAHFKGHNYGGMHIHVSRNAVSPAMFKKLFTLLYNNAENKQKWLTITQRKESELDHWAGMTVNNDADFAAHYYNQGGRFTSTRYTALNVTNNTVEFRIFNSNLRTERVLKNIEAVKSLLDWSRNARRQNTMKSYLNFALSNAEKYPNFAAFLKEKNYNKKTGEFCNTTETQLAEA